MELTLEHKKEMVIDCFARTLDKEMSYDKAGLSFEEIDQLEEDEEFQYRLRLCIIKEREEVINNYKDFMNSDNERVAFEATKDFAKLMYPEYFVDPKFSKKLKPEKYKTGEYDLSKLTDEELIELAKKVK
jgi:hypothetical protein